MITFKISCPVCSHAFELESNGDGVLHEGRRTYVVCEHCRHEIVIHQTHRNAIHAKRCGARKERLRDWSLCTVAELARPTTPTEFRAVPIVASGTQTDRSDFLCYVILVSVPIEKLPARSRRGFTGRSAALVKIGAAADPTQRGSGLLRDLWIRERIRPLRMLLLQVFEGGYDTESFLKRRFDTFRVKTDWQVVGNSEFFRAAPILKALKLAVPAKATITVEDVQLLKGRYEMTKWGVWNTP